MVDEEKHPGPAAGDRPGQATHPADRKASRSFGPRRFRRFSTGRRRRCTPCDPSLFDWKDATALSRFQTPTGRLMSRKRTGLCSQCQRRLAKAVKRARFMALIPYTT